MRNENPPDKRLPNWLRRPKDLRGLRDIRLKLRHAVLHTVCEEARCPNMAECFARHDATFLILGHTCSRTCAFCGIDQGIPQALDGEEPSRVASAAESLGLRHVVITSVTRDDLPDKGAKTFAETIVQVRRKLPGASVEVLTPDFSGDPIALETVLSTHPDVFGHNMETVPSLYPRVRPQADPERSLMVLSRARAFNPGLTIKSGFMVGLGETQTEIHELIRMMHTAGVDCLTIGQYLQPSRTRMSVRKYWEPHFFEEWACLAKSIGIRYVASGPLVRSSYQARELLEGMDKHAVRTD
ncbi:MAG: lipoyl synthase [Syntrophaceae bacterium]